MWRLDGVCWSVGFFSRLGLLWAGDFSIVCADDCVSLGAWGAVVGGGTTANAAAEKVTRMKLSKRRTVFMGSSIVGDPHTKCDIADMPNKNPW